MKILIVDDEKLNLKIANDYLEKSNIKCEVTLCNDSTEVEKLVSENNFDIILLDIVMPKMTGIDVLKIIRSKEEYDNIQILMFTSLTDNNNFKKCFENGADDYVNKPIKEVEFFARLKAAIKTRSNAIMLEEMFERIKKQNNELKLLNKTLQDTQFQIIQKEKLAAIGELAAGVAHEINNPLGYLGSNLETLSKFVSKIQTMIEEYRGMIKGKNLDERDIENYNMSKEEAYIRDMEKKLKIDLIMGEMGGIIKDSLDGANRVSKIVSSLQNFAKTGFEDEMVNNDLNIIVDEAVLLLNNDLKSVAEIEKINGIITNIICNRSEIGQVIMSLLTNSLQAIKSQNNENGKIIIRTFEEDGKVCCSISDNGPGIEENVLSKIFDPFFTTKEIGTAVGVGLTIAHDVIVKRHHGEFDVKSIPGKETIFTFKFKSIN
ncbi:response regulator [Clostridium saccharoperbutylacetonicum]|uniref:response regulator n=1 Tax=Clostridium saccharoperbutylacetonicum TaxID=36745 RepID=UPI000983EC56|nr:response regulator [Clostridium saccharoperbutylacetonicum]AQR94946.1 sensor protein ZraS [Clostridium saccharoperbutylacetonicum]NSB30789.1 signal transduction histidine kinase [Clostridium saccharoperbutylacetonicum]